MKLRERVPKLSRIFILAKASRINHSAQQISVFPQPIFSFEIAKAYFFSHFGCNSFPIAVGVSLDAMFSVGEPKNTKDKTAKILTGNFIVGDTAAKRSKIHISKFLLSCR